MMDFNVVVVLFVSAATFGRQIVFATSRTDVLSDPLFTDAVIGSRIDKINACVEYAI